jgi:hypothetical protein
MSEPMMLPTDDGGHCLHRLVRRIPVDSEAIFRETGLKRGVIGKSPFVGWCVQNRHGEPGPNIACITPPPMEDEETFLRIEGREWLFYSPNAKDQQPD